MILVDFDGLGLRVERTLSVSGYDHAPNGHAEISLNDFRVPAGNLLLGEGRTAKSKAKVMDECFRSTGPPVQGASTPSAKRSVKINCPHRTASQRKRRTSLSGSRDGSLAVDLLTDAGSGYENGDDSATCRAPADRCNATAFFGSFNVKEGYLEAVVPLLRDVPLASSLDLNGAVRVADYSTIGTQTTWKIGGTYEPVDGVVFRTTRSRDIRAPALHEFYSQGAVVNSQIAVCGFSVFIPANQSLGNPDLDPEIADTLTAGAVLKPRFAPGLSASIDYFNIKVDGAITNVRGAAATLCDAGNALACSFFTFDPATGAPTSMSVPQLNLASLNYVGYDFALQYHAELGDFLPGTFDINWNATYMDEAKIDLGADSGPVNRAGENGGVNTGAIARLTSVLASTYSHKGSFDHRAIALHRQGQDRQHVQYAAIQPHIQ